MREKLVNKFKNPISLFIGILLVMLIAGLQNKAYDIKNNENPFPIGWDIYGYYLYLPATFIYNDLGLENNDWITKTREKYKPSTSFYQVTQGEENKKIIVYNIGYSFIYAPGFLIANALAPSLGHEKDGFSKPYQISLILTAFIFSLIGIFMFRKISLRFFSDKITALLMIFILVGSNYFFQSIYDGIMPHNLLFTINCFIIWYTIKWNENPTLKNILLLSFFIGFATICRPTELLWLLLPLLWKVTTIKELLEKVKKLIANYIHLILALIVVIGIIFIQLFYYKYTSGNYFVVNLHSEGFSFLHPYIFEFLFSYKKGWLLYTPIMIFGLVGFYFTFRLNKPIVLALFSYLVIYIYVASSWECWWYAASFGQRPMVETYAMMLFPMGYFLVGIQPHKKSIQFLVYIILIALLLLNLFQTWQFRNYIIDAERMTKEYYWSIFGKTKIDEKEKEKLSIDRYQENFLDYGNYQTNYYKKEVFFLDFEKEFDNIIDTISVSGKNSLLLTSNNPFSKSFEENYFDITSKNYIWIRASVWVYLKTPYLESNSCIVISTEAKGKSYKYVTSNYDNFDVKLNSWNLIHLDYLTPFIRHNDDKIKAYFWNVGSVPVLIDDFKIEVFEPKKYVEN